MSAFAIERNCAGTRCALRSLAVLGKTSGWNAGRNQRLKTILRHTGLRFKLSRVVIAYRTSCNCAAPSILTRPKGYDASRPNPSTIVSQRVCAPPLVRPYHRVLLQFIVGENRHRRRDQSHSRSLGWPRIATPHAPEVERLSVGTSAATIHTTRSRPTRDRPAHVAGSVAFLTARVRFAHIAGGPDR